MKSMQNLLDEYAESHRNQTNQLIHWICVPLIYFSIVTFLVALRMETGWPVTTIVITLGMTYYLNKSKSLLIGMLAFTMLCLVVAGMIQRYSNIDLWKIGSIIFISAWIGQFFGHKIEGKKPSFLRDLEFLLVGPAWLMSKIYKKAGWGI